MPDSDDIHLATIELAVMLGKMSVESRSHFAEFSHELTANQSSASNNLSAVVATMPPDIFLETLKFGNNEISLKGISPSERSIQQYLANLEGNSAFKQVILGNLEVAQGNSSLMSFSIKLVM